MEFGASTFPGEEEKKKQSELTRSNIPIIPIFVDEECAQEDKSVPTVSVNLAMALRQVGPNADGLARAPEFFKKEDLEEKEPAESNPSNHVSNSNALASAAEALTCVHEATGSQPLSVLPDEQAVEAVAKVRAPRQPSSSQSFSVFSDEPVAQSVAKVCAPRPSKSFSVLSDEQSQKPSHSFTSSRDPARKPKSLKPKKTPATTSSFSVFDDSTSSSNQCSFGVYDESKSSHSKPFPVFDESKSSQTSSSSCFAVFDDSMASHTGKHSDSGFTVFCDNSNQHTSTTNVNRQPSLSFSVFCDEGSSDQCEDTGFSICTTLSRDSGATSGSNSSHRQTNNLNDINLGLDDLLSDW